nr:MAG TPA: hypothetical protein [Caudoviricetes sp.]
MSGMEMIALSAALGAGVGGISAANRGGNPIEGALLGGATGAAGGALGGAATGALGGAGSAAGGTAAQAFPVAMDAAIPAVALDGTTASLIGTAALPETASWAAPFLVPGSPSQDAMMTMAQASNYDAALANVGANVNPMSVSGGFDMKALNPAMNALKGIGGQQQMGQLSVPQMRRSGGQVNITAPIASLLEEQNRVPVRRISLV